jgi:hypothetical protein
MNATCKVVGNAACDKITKKDSKTNSVCKTVVAAGCTVATGGNVYLGAVTAAMKPKPAY